MEVTAYVERQGGGRSEIAPKRLYQMDEKPGVWEYQIDLKRELGKNWSSSVGSLKLIV